MSSRWSVPRIRVDLPDGSPCNLSPSSTLDIRDFLGQARLLPELLAEDFVFDDADIALHFEDGRLQEFPSFPMGRQPPLFVLNSHRARLPFPIRPGAFELGDFCKDEEDICPLLTAPTIPRMKMMIKEQLYVQKWVDALTPDNPPKHIPWTCEKPTAKRKWIAEGSIFPAVMIRSDRFSTEQLGIVQERSGIITNTNGRSTLDNQVPHSSELCALSEPHVSIHASTESRTSTTQARTKSADVDPGILRGESKTSPTPRRIARASQAPTSGLPIRTTLSTLDAPLAARRGKSLDGLKLKACVNEHLEYPDIPTAFRGSPIVWSPRFDAFAVPSFTDHESMLVDLRSKCAALGDGVSTYIQEPARSSLSVDEWAFIQGLATFDDLSLGPINNQIPREIVTDTDIFLPDDVSTPAKSPCFTARLGFVPHLHSTPALQPPGSRLSDPPELPLPPRPALINPSTPPHVRGILKKAKSVRFEDMSTKESGNRTSLVSSPHASPKRSPPSPLPVPSKRLCTPTPHTVKPPISPASPKGLPGKDLQKKSAPRARLPPKRAKANDRAGRIYLRNGNAREASHPNLANTPDERSCRISHVKENVNPTVGSRVQPKPRLSITEIDVRRGIEGNTKSRLSTPLRNIFRFR